MKILILGFTKLKYMPYLDLYYKGINKKDNEISVVYWNRDLKEEDLSDYTNCELIEFKCFQKDEVAKYKKVLSFLKYRYFVRKIIKKRKYDFLIVLHTLPAVLIHRTLTKKYASRFILDYRDSTFENISFFRNKVASIVKASKYTFISSDGFRKYLPEEYENKVITSHNLLIDSLNHRDDKKNLGKQSDKIRICFWGFIRHKDVNIALIDRISYDKRFELHYYGREQETAFTLKEHANKIGYSNVFFHGEYKPDERYAFIRETDLIHNIYFDNNTMLAMGNKYYDGVIFRIPQICMPGSFMGEKVTKSAIGVECSPYELNFCDLIYEYYKGIDKDAFEASCDSELDKILSEYFKGKEIISNLKNV